VSDKLPAIVSQLPRDLRTFLDRVRDVLRSNGTDRFVTAEELLRTGVASQGPGGSLAPGAGTGGLPFLPTPPAPTTVTATAAIQNIIVEWDEPTYQGHAYAEVWGASTDNIGTAVQLGMAPGAIYVDAIGPSSTRYYWVRFVNANNEAGPFNGLSGTVATTGPAVDYLLGVLTGQLSESQLTTSLSSRIDLIDGPVTTVGTIPNQLAALQGQIDDLNDTPVYDNATTYAADDIVQYDGGLYKALSTTTGNLPTDATYWLKIGDYSSLADVVAAHTNEISLLNTGLSGEVTARELLATQLRGAYTGTDIASVTTGLLFSERTVRADADSALSSSITTLASTVSTNNSTLTAAINTEATTRANADTALSTQITTLASTVTTNNTAVTAAINTEATTRADADNSLFAQYTVKVDVNGYVSGFGLASTANNATPFSEFTIVADKFSIAPVASNPAAADGSPFFYLTSPTLIDGVTVPAGAYMKAAYIHDASITNAKIANAAVDNAKIADAAIDDAKIANLSADKVTFGEMSGARIQVGTLSANRITTGTLNAAVAITADSGLGETVTISGEGYVETNGPLRRTVMDAGNVTTFLKVPSVGEVPYQTLAHVEVGVCQNNTQVTIPGYFAVQPRVIVSPAELGVYNKDFSSQSQTLICSPNAVTETTAGSYQWRFTPTATLSLAAATNGVAINYSSGTISGDNFVSTTYQLPGNSTQLSVTSQFLSVRGTGTGGSYFFRRVVWYVDYSADGSNWTQGNTTTVSMGANIGSPINSTLAFNLPSAGAWFWRVRADASDAGGTFSTGAAEYEYAQATISRSDSVTASTGTVFGPSNSRTVTAPYALSYSPPAGFTIYQITGTLTYNYSVGRSTSGGSASVGEGTSSWHSAPIGNTASGNGLTQPMNKLTPTIFASVSATFSSSFAFASITATAFVATVYSRKLITNSTTAANNYNIISRTATLATSQVLATGTLNWMAVGQ
jgi:hypothetical protein